MRAKYRKNNTAPAAKRAEDAILSSWWKVTILAPREKGVAPLIFEDVFQLGHPGVYE
jgi:hypothetical protein